MRCEEASEALADLADGVEVGPSAATRHIHRCLRCQAELVQHRRVSRTLAQLRRHLIDPGPDLLVELLSGIEAAGQERASRSALHRHRVAYVAAATVATAAGAAGAVLLASRSRRTRLVPAG